MWGLEFESTEMKEIKIYGASDDLIEVEGPGTLQDEGNGPGYVELSTGDVFFVDYEDAGVWNVQHVVKSGEVDVEILRKEEEDDGGYTGHAIVGGAIEWFDFWGDWPPEEAEMRDRVSDRIDDLKGDALRVAYAEIRNRR